MRQARTVSELYAHPAALATDLDGTLTTDGRRLSPVVTATLLEVKKGGTKLILATGRCTREAREIAGPGLFDAVVAENGAVLVVDGEERRTAPPGWTGIREKLLPLVGGGCEEVILSAGKERLAEVRRYLPKQARIEVNKDRLMVLPLGVNKGKGLLEALSVLGVPPARTACLGDGENDVPMFDAVGTKAALGNSVAALKRKADFVTAKSAGEGATEAMARLFPKLRVRGRRGASP